jgi:diguanylate cyclase (GGDEF)-like protein/PAS domain S-box-containing protein
VVAVRVPRLTAARYLGLCCGVLLAYIGAHGNVTATTVLYQAASVSCLCAFAVGFKRRGRPIARAWLLLYAGVTLFAAGDLLWFLRNAFGVAVGPGWAPDVAYLAAYVPFAVALIGFAAGRRHPLDTVRRELADTGIVFLSGFTLLWFFVLDKIIDDGGLHGTGLALAVAYPTLDLLLLALLVRAGFAATRWPTAYRLLAAAFAIELVGDVFWRLAIASGVDAVDAWINLIFISGYALWGAGALHRSAAQVGEHEAGSERLRQLTSRRLRLLALAAVPPVAIIVARQGRLGDTADWATLAIAIAGIPLLTLVRVGDIVQHLNRFACETRRAHADLDAVIAASPIPICVADARGVVRVWNAAAAKVSGYAASEVVGRTAPLRAALDPERVFALYRAALEGVHLQGVEVKVLNRAGEEVDARFSTAPLGDDNGSIVALFEDVTVARRQAETINFLATHDPLTTLVNRTAFEEELKRALDRPGVPATLVFFDLDNFKFVNDTGGHSTGDKVLVELTQRLQSLLRPSDVFARFSGDEFAILLAGADAVTAMRAVARLLEEARDYRLLAPDGIYDVSLSAGLYPLAVGDEPSIALRRADEALYEAKARGKNNAQLWEPAVKHRPAETRAWSPVIKDALAHGRVEAFFQPIVALATGEVVFHEALCRLRAEDGACIAPAAFLGPAERLGLMPAIDRRMVENAACLLHDDVYEKVFVNLSPSSFDDDELFALLRATLDGLESGRLGFEITERTSLRDFDGAARKLTILRELGALIAVDDFGLGFSSFVRLAELPCDLIKISADLGGKRLESRTAIVDAITWIAHAHGKAVVLEGVETEADAAHGRLRGIEYAQGWHFGRPAPPIKTKSAQLA